MAEKKPAMMFYVADYFQDTRTLSLAARGAWMDFLCVMHRSQNRGTICNSMQGYARILGTSVEQTERVIEELVGEGICDSVTEHNKNVTLGSRRMMREEKERISNLERQARHRNKHRKKASNGNVTSYYSYSYSFSNTRKEKEEKEIEGFVNWFISLLPDGQTFTQPNLDQWADTYDKLKRIDSRTKDEIKTVCLWARNDDFWKSNFLSPVKLRRTNGDGVKYFDVFKAKMTDTKSTGEIIY